MAEAGDSAPELREPRDAAGGRDLSGQDRQGQVTPDSQGAAPASEPAATATSASPTAPRPAVSDPAVAAEERGVQDNLKRLQETAEATRRAAEAAVSAVASLGALGELKNVPDTLNELVRLRVRDVELADRLHADVTKLRTGELAAAMAPLLFGMLHLHDQMVRLGALDAPTGDAALLRNQLLQTLEVVAGLTVLPVEIGEAFSAARHSGTRRVTTPDLARENTVAGVIRVGFARADATVMRAADVEVFRFVASAGEPAETVKTVEPAAGTTATVATADAGTSAPGTEPAAPEVRTIPAPPAPGYSQL